jgi:hypothetical protein
MSGTIRAGVAGPQQLQPQVHGGHDGRVRTMPGRQLSSNKLTCFRNKKKGRFFS